MPTWKDIGIVCVGVLSIFYTTNVLIVVAEIDDKIISLLDKVNIIVVLFVLYCGSFFELVKKFAPLLNIDLSKFK